jgi:hypothetical protein
MRTKARARMSKSEKKEQRNDMRGRRGRTRIVAFSESKEQRSRGEERD